MSLSFILFQNGKAWPETRQGSGYIKATVRASSSACESLLDAAIEEITGSCVGLEEIDLVRLGGGLVSVTGRVCEGSFTILDIEDEMDEDSDPSEIAWRIPATDPLLPLRLQVQYGLDEPSVRHILDGNLGPDAYGEECILSIRGTGRQIHTPAHPHECSYARVTVDGMEFAYWASDEFGEDPSLVLGALIGAAAKSI